MFRFAFLALLLALVTVHAAAPPAAPEHWSFRPPLKRPAPAVRESAWIRSPVDGFVLARLDKAGLKPAKPADRVALIRRLTIDLIGLPPTPAEVDDFVRDPAPDAHARLVDRLLADPRHGERWAQHWLDVARFAESNGYELDAERPQAWRYRDWVIRSLNADLPYDRFVTLQLAGDLMAKEPDGLIAAGFNRCGPIHQVSGNVDQAEVRNEFLTEIAAGVGGAFLGLTMTCARCHDHKFDPISTTDYYRLEAFFSAAKPKEVELASATEHETHKKELAALQAKLAPLKNAVAKIEVPYRQNIREAKLAKLEPHYKAALATEDKKRTAEQKKLVMDAQPLIKVTWDEVVDALSDRDREKRAALRNQMHDLTARTPQPPARAWTLEEGKEPLGSHVLRRGNVHRKGTKVPPGFPEVLGSAGVTPSNRLALAQWITRPNHPLTARVIVNRLWQHHFGAGLVRTPNDFGMKGERPTHPELLDYLALELIESGWSLKHVHRLIVSSNAYQMADWNAEEAKASVIDADNRLLWRMNRRRLEGESLRDGVLAVTGQMTGWHGGPMIRVPLEPEVYDLIFTEDEPDGLWPVTPDERQHTRRSIYLFNKRNVRQPLLEAFDQPDTLSPCPVRPVSTFAPQALILLNGPFMQNAAKAFASRLYREAKSEERIGLAYRLALGREPTKVEREMSVSFLREQAALLNAKLRAREPVALVEGLPEGTNPAEAAALSDLCLALLNRNAFVHY